jgi:hypothetical protein
MTRRTAQGKRVSTLAGSAAVSTVRPPLPPQVAPQRQDQRPIQQQVKFKLQ